MVGIRWFALMVGSQAPTSYFFMKDRKNNENAKMHTAWIWTVHDGILIDKTLSFCRTMPAVNDMEKFPKLFAIFYLRVWNPMQDPLKVILYQRIAWGK